ncbi:MAG: tRNA (adenosine(37)-N6)-threonylcarbamoyltransferase complex ATPase subunit type 1 TsaE [Symbiobacterium sp.]|uniref:tRNA (adenosine(37)-N6)-threonylcarbamoyltransferase complex ATPase subunit type 1 TsaE n=1 Tax=Symbiobacterium sp. TaxID=1971213 RepID=UPI0034646062
MLRIISRSPDETLALGRWLGSRLRPGDFVALTGDLGTGKTALATGILAGLGVARTGGSPTFTLLWEYEGRIPVYHWDVYRVDDPAELEDLGYEEYFFSETGVNLVEWADRVRELWPDDVLEIALSYGAGAEERVLAFTGAERYRPLLEELAHAGFGL